MCIDVPMQKLQLSLKLLKIFHRESIKIDTNPFSQLRVSVRLLITTKKVDKNFFLLIIRRLFFLDANYAEHYSSRIFFPGRLQMFMDDC